MEESVTVILCPYCDFQCYNHDIMLKHTRSIHENDPRFSVYCHLCGQFFRKWCTLKKHLHRDHQCETATGSGEQTDQDDETTGPAGDDFMIGSMHTMMPDDTEASVGTTFEIDDKWQKAKFLLRVTEEHALTHHGVNNLCDSVQWLVDYLSSETTERIKVLLPDDTNAEIKKQIFDACKPGDVFDGLNTRFLREKYYENYFNYVEPKVVEMGTEWKWVTEKGHRRLTKIQKQGYVVDFFSGLKMLLSNPDVRNEIQKPHSRDDGIMMDFCDAYYFKNHKIFNSYRNALQLILYYDDIEVANPLGAKAGIHKLGVFYYTLGNIRPIFRSSLQSIQLVCIAKSNDIKQYGCEALLQPFFRQVNQLGKDEGFKLCLSDEELILHGAVICLCGDIPASNYIGGFKEGVALSLRKCRRCMAISEDMNSKFHAAQFISRNIESHMNYLTLIQEASTHSTTYGINRASPLLQLTDFDITKCLPFDIMHTLYEGVVTYHLNLLLHHLIDTCHYFTLDQLNHIIRVHPYGYTETDTKPSTINRESPTSNFHFKLSASQAMTLIRLLPFMIGSFIDDDDEHWQCFLLLWDICSLTTAFTVSKSDAKYLAWLVEMYLKTFKEQYDVTITPKLHYLVHLPQQMFGPLRHHWCMRFESKNAQIKSFLSHSFKNTPLTAAIHHQQWMCYTVLTDPRQTKSNFFYAGDEVNSGTQTTIQECIAEICCICGEENSDNTLTVLRPKSIKVHGVLYKPGAIIRVNMTEPLHDDDIPFRYVLIKDIYIYKDHKLIIGQIVEYICCCPPIRANKVKVTEQRIVCCVEDLYCNGVLHLMERGSDYYLIEKDNRINAAVYE